MEKWFLPQHMSKLANQTVKCFGYDQRGIVDYSFNHLGFRSPDPTTAPRLVVIGNSISFGIGIDFAHTYGALLAQALNRHIDNRAVGCFFHTNHDHLANIELLSKQNQDSVFLIQINNLDRRREQNQVFSGNDHDWCVKQLESFVDQTSELLKHIPHKYVYWDNIEYNLPSAVKKNIVLINKFHLDTSIDHNADTFGVQSHRAIAKALFHLTKFN